MPACTCPNGGHKNELGTWHSFGCPATVAGITAELAEAAFAISSAINGGVEDTILDTVGAEAVERFCKAVEEYEKVKRADRK